MSTVAARGLDVGISVERFHKFACKTPAFDLIAELDIADKMRWVPAAMVYFSQGKLHHRGDPISLLKFPGLNLISKLGCGFFVFAYIPGMVADLPLN